jgi:hypothetical protein
MIAACDANLRPRHDAQELFFFLLPHSNLVHPDLGPLYIAWFRGI